MALISAPAAAKRMGVKVETIYAYVSRGLLERHPAEDGRSSLFDARAVEALAKRGRPRAATQRGAMDLTIETALTCLSLDGVRYRGRPSAQLARAHTFEQVAALLWSGTLEDGHRPWRGTIVPVDPTVGRAGALREIVCRLITPRADTGPVASAPDVEEVAAAGRWMIATMVDSLTPLGDGVAARLQLPTANGQPLRATIAGRLWGRLSARRASPEMVALLNSALVLMADHELAASTLAVRVAASTWASPAAVVSTGLGVLSGPLHGSASREARVLLDRAGELGAARAVAELRRAGLRVPGFGHRVYPGADPRATVLFDMLHGAVGDRRNRSLAIAEDVRNEVLRQTGIEPNVDFALATLTGVASMPGDAAEAIMAVARTAGWLAHAIEEYSERPLRFRTRAAYIGS